MRNNTMTRFGLIAAAAALIAAPVFAQPSRQGREGRQGRQAGQAREGQGRQGQGRQGQGRVGGIQGSWNITVTDGESTYPSWLGVQEKDGKMEARFLGRAGSVGGTEDFKFENGTVTFKAHGREWTGKLEGPAIEGTWKSGDKEGKWVAKRSIRAIDVSGEWKMSEDKGATLTLKQEQRQVTGTWKENGKETQIEQARRMGNRLGFTLDGKRCQGVVQGDVLKLECDGKTLTARRDRKWGEPVELFNGKEADLKANWEAMGAENHWKVVDGVMTNGGNGTENIVTKRKDFRNFKLHVEFKVPKNGNSGVYLRGRHEVQIADSYDKPIEAGGCGALYSRVLPSVNASKPAGEWQTYDITFVDNYLTVIHNGKTIMDNVEVEGITGGAIDSDEWEPGPIYLQGDHSEIFFHKIILTPALRE